MFLQSPSAFNTSLTHRYVRTKLLPRGSPAFSRENPPALFVGYYEKKQLLFEHRCA
jgi:hypothetical protein